MTQPNIETLLAESLRPVAAPTALWDRVWQPRLQASRESIFRGFAFVLPVAAAVALVVTVAASDPLHAPASLRVNAARARVQSSEIVSQLERSEAVSAVSRSSPATNRESDSRIDAGCGLCHTL